MAEVFNLSFKHRLNLEVGEMILGLTLAVA
jgi:hypothetical protein